MMRRMAVGDYVDCWVEVRSGVYAIRSFNDRGRNGRAWCIGLPGGRLIVVKCNGRLTEQAVRVPDDWFRSPIGGS